MPEFPEGDIALTVVEEEEEAEETAGETLDSSPLYERLLANPDLSLRQRERIQQLQEVRATARRPLQCASNRRATVLRNRTTGISAMSHGNALQDCRTSDSTEGIAVCYTAEAAAHSRPREQ